MSKKIRLFIAADLEEKTKEYLEEVIKLCEATDIPIRFYNKDHFHLTLKFLSSVTVEMLEDIQQCLEAIAAKSSPFKLTLSKLGYASPPRPGSAIWVECHGDLETLAKLKKEIDNNLEFTAHVSIGRFKKVPQGQIKLVAKRIKERPLPRSKEEFEVKTISLIQSTLTPKGPLYKTIQSFGLGYKISP